jgi:hypothetical protein
MPQPQRSSPDANVKPSTLRRSPRRTPPGAAAEHAPTHDVFTLGTVLKRLNGGCRRPDAGR